MKILIPLMGGIKNIIIEVDQVDPIFSGGVLVGHALLKKDENIGLKTVGFLHFSWSWIEGGIENIIVP